MSVFQGCERVAQGVAEVPDYSRLTKAKLSEIAEELGLDLPARATKAEMIEAIEESR